MKTPEEILKGMRVCFNRGGIECDGCPYEKERSIHCIERLHRDAILLIEDTMRGQRMRKKCEGAPATPQPMTRERILARAKECVCGEREQDYGTPEDSFTTIASLWSTYMGVEFTPTNVAVMMALLKVARIKEGPKHMDNWIDLAGYAACGGEIADGG